MALPGNCASRQTDMDTAPALLFLKIYYFIKFWTFFYASPQIHCNFFLISVIRWESVSLELLLYQVTVICILDLTLCCKSNLFLGSKHPHASPLRNKQRQAEEKRQCAVYSGRSHRMAFNRTYYYLTLSEDVSGESASKRILRWRESLRGETDRSGPKNETFGTRVGFGTKYKNSNLDFCWFWNLWRKLRGGPVVLLSLCHPVLPLRPYTTWSTWQLRPVGTSAPVACGNSAQPVHWSLATSLVQTLTHTVRLPECVLHQAVEPRKLPLYQNSLLKRKENCFLGIFFPICFFGEVKVRVYFFWTMSFCSLSTFWGSFSD